MLKRARSSSTAQDQLSRILRSDWGYPELWNDFLLGALVLLIVLVCLVAYQWIFGNYLPAR